MTHHLSVRSLAILAAIESRALTAAEIARSAKIAGSMMTSYLDRLQAASCAMPDMQTRTVAGRKRRTWTITGRGQQELARAREALGVRA